MARGQLFRGAQAFVCEGGRHAHIEDGCVDSMPVGQGKELIAGAGHGHDLLPGSPELQFEALAEQRGIIGDGYARWDPYLYPGAESGSSFP